MPLERCTIEGRPGWRWGGEGHCFTGPDAEERALAQGRAILASQQAADLEAFAWYRDQPRVSRRLSAIAAAGRRDVRATATVRLTITDAARTKRVPVQAFPSAMERRYLAALRKRTAEVNALLMEAIRRTLGKVGPDIDERARTDTKASDLRALLQVIARVERAVESGSPPDAATIEILGGQVASFTTRAVTRQVASVIGIDVTARASTSLELVEAWVADNVDLITSIDSRFFDEVRSAVRTTVLEGKSTKSLMASIEERYGVSKSRAELIARDQIGKLNGQVTAARQQALGIESYRWSNVGDERVRVKHQDHPTGLGNTIRRWDDPHETEGHPGTGSVNCRCTALPILPAK